MEPAPLSDEGISISTDGSSASCRICHLNIIPNSAKSIKQHLKSITHKRALRDPPKQSKRNKETNDLFETASPTVEACALCDTLETEGVFHIAFDQADDNTWNEETIVCIAPPFMQKPRKSEMLAGEYKSPFITFQNASMEEYPENLEHSVQLYCKAPVQRMPNIDVDHQHVEITSLNQARRVLLEALASKVSYWCAFAVDSEVIVNPSWWPPSNPVPGYTQVIVGSGPTDIGIHTDSFGDEKRPVDTYITICAGVKQVLMLPPGKNFFEEMDEEEEGTKKLQFPLRPTEQLLKRIHSAGGYFFKLKTRPQKEPLTLFVPKGWHHWLLGRSKWAVIFGASRF